MIQGYHSGLHRKILSQKIKTNKNDDQSLILSQIYGPGYICHCFQALGNGDFLSVEAQPAPLGPKQSLTRAVPLHSSQLSIEAPPHFVTRTMVNCICHTKSPATFESLQNVCLSFVRGGSLWDSPWGSGPEVKIRPVRSEEDSLTYPHHPSHDAFHPTHPCLSYYTITESLLWALQGNLLFSFKDPPCW